MNQLKIQDQTLDSREVAEMMETEHYKILRKLEGDKSRRGYIQILNDSQMGAVDYFIPSEYKDDKGELRKCYLFTKMGCEFIANKFTGEKGILFTAKYVQKFNAMEQHLVSGISIAEIKASMETIADDIFQRKADEIEVKASELYRPSHSQKLNICKYIKNRLGVGATQDEYEMVKQRILIKLDGGKWEDIPAETLRDSLSVIDESIRVIKMDREVNQISLFE